MLGIHTWLWNPSTRGLSPLCGVAEVCGAVNGPEGPMAVVKSVGEFIPSTYCAGIAMWKAFDHVAFWSHIERG